MNKHYKDIAGLKFGLLTAIEYVGIDKTRNALWRCKCDCGEETIARGFELRNGNTRSCGCLPKKMIVDRLTTHGESNTRLYECWEAIIQRTTNPKNTSYKKYGGIGIGVCDEWRKYTNFASWARANGYNDTLTIDRIDPKKGYSPDNCRWADYYTQNNHLSRNTYIELDGESKTLAQWARIYGIDYQTLVNRVVRRKWELLKALTTPVIRRENAGSNSKKKDMGLSD